MYGFVNPFGAARNLCAILLPLFIVLSLGAGSDAQGGTAEGAMDRAFAGPLRVIDGDTLDVGPVRVRLHGIDAPEQSQKCSAGGSGHWGCGAWVTGQLRNAYEGALARCEALDRDRYGRVVARCRVEGVDIGAWLVEQGMALAFTRYSRDYLHLETAAREAGVGLHAVAFDAPAQFRHRPRHAIHDEGPAGCGIKGNISRNGGQRIYHLPGQRDYARTHIRAAQGERWFCSEEAARAAGWRRALR